MNYKFRAIKSGDHESFCFDVSKEDFKKITGKNPNKFDKSFFNIGKYRIYPDDLFNDVPEDECGIEITVTVSK